MSITQKFETLKEHVRNDCVTAEEKVYLLALLDEVQTEEEWAAALEENA